MAQEQAAEYKALIEAQTAEIQQIQAEKQRAAEEAARRAAAEEARKQEAAKKAAARAEAEEEESEEASDESDSEESYDEESYDEGSSEDEYYEEESSDDGDYDEEESYEEDEDYEEEESYDEDEDYDEEESYDEDEDYYEEDSYEEEESSSDAYYSGNGQAVADYACQFVGNPYVWGGTSLTNGADCSGFIMSVYANFGVSLPHSSAAMRSCGTEVSYSEAMPGDIICYSGHVAIYLGGGSIVHASNEKDGIKISGNAAYRTILSVRRVI